MATALLLVAIGSANVGRADDAQLADGSHLAGWYGRLEWSFHHKDRTIPPKTSRSETKFAGQADVRINRSSGQDLIGSLFGSQKVETLWWGYPHGSGEVCKGSAPSTPVNARVSGTPPSGSTPLSLRLTDVEAKIAVEWSGGGPSLSCTGAVPIDNGPTLSGLVRALQPIGDGTYKAEFQSSQPLLDVRWSMVLRPGYCGFGPDRGGVFAQSTTGQTARIFSEPAAVSSPIAFVPNGTRLVYDQVRQVDGHLWFHVSPSGRQPGWVSGKDLACRRPGDPLPRWTYPPADPPRGTPSYGGARG